jgi:hypothetical protein
MPRPKLLYERVRVRLDGFVPVGQDPKDDELLARLDALPPRTKFPTVWMWLKLGKALESVTPETSDEEIARMVREAESASEALFGRFDEDDS